MKKIITVCLTIILMMNVNAQAQIVTESNLVKNEFGKKSCNPIRAVPCIALTGTPGNNITTSDNIIHKSKSGYISNYYQNVFGGRGVSLGPLAEYVAITQEIDKIDLQGNVTEKKEFQYVPNSIAKDELIYRELFFFSGKYYVLASTFNSDTKLTDIYVVEFDMDNLDYEGTPKYLFSGREVKTYSFYHDRLDYNFLAKTYSPDSTKMAFLVKTTTTGIKDPQQFKVYVFKADFEKLFESSCSLKVTDQHFLITGFFIDNNAVFSVAGFEEQFDIDEVDIKGDMSGIYEGHKFALMPHLLSFSNEGKEVWDYKVEFAGEQFGDVIFKSMKNGNIFCSGFLTNTGKTGYDKVFAKMISPSQKTELYKTQYKIESKINLRFRNFCERADGKYYLTAEVYVCGGDAAKFGDNLIWSLSNDLTFEWFKSIIKDQNSFSNGAGYFSFENNNKLYFLLNEKTGSNTSYQYIFSEDGNLKKEELLSATSKYIFQPFKTQRLDENHLFLFFDNDYASVLTIK